MKTVTVPVEVPTRLFEQMTKIAAPYGRDTKTILKAILEAKARRLDNENDEWLVAGIYANRKAAQAAADAHIQVCRYIREQAYSLRYWRGGKAVVGRFWGARQHAIIEGSRVLLRRKHYAESRGDKKAIESINREWDELLGRKAAA